MCKISSVILALIVQFSCIALAGQCTHTRDTAFYENGGYKIGQIQINSPYNFIFLVRQRLDAIKNELPAKERGMFVVTDYDRSFTVIRDAMKADSALGQLSPFKAVAVASGLANCQEDAAPHTVDIVYQVFSTDPIPTVQASPELRRAFIEQPATSAAETTLQSNYKIVPRFGYDGARRRFGGADFNMRVPGLPLNTFYLSAQGSSSSKEIETGFRGSAQPGQQAFDHIDYNLGYSLSEVPAYRLRLAKGYGQGHFIATTKPTNTTTSSTRFRYGASIEAGNQQTNVAGRSTGYGAIGLYGGLTNTTQYSETAVSYGISVGGRELSNLTYTRHIGDVTYSLRFPGLTHRPWDVMLRGTVGGVTSAANVLLNDRFFGGNWVGGLIPADSWSIPNGPVVRSIAAYRLAGRGFGGTSFYSGNVTVGKVIFASPLIPVEIETAPGFDEAISSGEKTALKVLADEYEAASPEFGVILADLPPKLKSDVEDAQSLLASIHKRSTGNATLEAATTEADNKARTAKNLVLHLADPGKSKTERVLRLEEWPVRTSSFRRLVSALQRLETATPGDALQLIRIEQSIESHLSDLEGALTRTRTGPVSAAAELRAKQVMARPREVIESLRREANRYSVSLIGLADVGRLWPDPSGNHYAFGGGGRFSIVNVNFTLGYAVNPNPKKELGQGRGAFLFSISYTNLFH